MRFEVRSLYLNWAFSSKFLFLILIIEQAALQGCYHTHERRVTFRQVMTANRQVTSVRIIPEEKVNFEVVGTVTKVSIQDISKRKGIKKLYMYITVKVDKTSPENIASQLKSKELSFVQRLDSNIEKQISVGNQVIVKVAANDLSQPQHFTIYELKKRK